MLANLSSDYQDYDLFLHERHQFWPRSDMFPFGQSEPVALAAGTELEIVFAVKDCALQFLHQCTIFTVFKVFSPCSTMN